MQQVEDIHVVTENGEQCFMWRSNQLTYIAQDRQELPHILATKFGTLATKLDLSYNTLTSFRNINLFTNLTELILDNNSLEDDQLDFRQNLRLKTLSLNKNKLRDLLKLIDSIRDCFPNLEFLSLIGNPLCPTPISTDSIAAGESDKITIFDSTSDQLTTCCIKDHNLDFGEQKYRHFIIYNLPNLRFLDSRLISVEERDNALRRCYWMKPLNSEAYNSTGRMDTTTRTSTDENALSHHDQDTQNNGSADGPFQMTIMSDYADDSPQSAATVDSSQTKGAFMRLSYKYTGKNSEGNRFIRNQDL